MAKSQKFTLPFDTKIEVVVSKDGRVRKKIMTYAQALALKKIRGWKYQNFQIGYCTIPETEDNNNN